MNGTGFLLFRTSRQRCAVAAHEAKLAAISKVSTSLKSAAENVEMAAAEIVVQLIKAATARGSDNMLMDAKARIVQVGPEGHLASCMWRSQHAAPAQAVQAKRLSIEHARAPCRSL